MAVKTVLSLISSYRVTDRTYDPSIALQYSFINEVFSIPTINKYIKECLP